MPQQTSLLFVSTALTLVAYVIVIQFAPFAEPSGAGTHIMRAEDYIGAPDRADTVLVGSSLTYMLPPSVLGPHIANLGMPSGAAGTGLMIVEQVESHPALVLVEVNVLTRGGDSEVVNSLLRFPERQLHARLRAFRANYDPVNMGWRGMMAFMGKIDREPVPQPDAMAALIEAQRQSFSRKPDLAGLRRNLAQLASLISTLQGRGIQVGFFQMPVASGLNGLPGATVVLQEALRTFPKNRFCWITLEVPGGAHTLDGLHLRAHDAALVAKEVAKRRNACMRPANALKSR